MLYFKTLEKDEQIKPKESKWKIILKMRKDINEIQNEQQLQVTKAKFQFSEKN